MLRIKKGYNVKDQSYYSFNDTVVYCMKIDVRHIRLRKLLFTSEAIGFIY